MKKIFIAPIILALTLAASAFAQFSPANSNASGYNEWFQKNNMGVFLGAYPNASVTYNGTNLLLDVLQGGGKVSMPDGVDLGSGSLTLGSSLVFEGSTADAYETTLTVVDPASSDKTITLPNQTGATILSAGGVAESANAISGGTGTLVFEGSTANGFETSLAVVDPTADQTFSVPNFAVNAAILASTLVTNTIDAANSLWAVSNGLVFEGATADGFELTVSPSDPAADAVLTLPALTGEVCVAGNIIVSAGANTACTTTCGAGKCCGGFDTGAPAIVGCADATADQCFCNP